MVWEMVGVLWLEVGRFLSCNLGMWVAQGHGARERWKRFGTMIHSLRFHMGGHLELTDRLAFGRSRSVTPQDLR